MIKHYFARIPHTGWFVRVPRWIYNRWPWAGLVQAWDSPNAEVSDLGSEAKGARNEPPKS